MKEQIVTQRNGRGRNAKSKGDEQRPAPRRNRASAPGAKSSGGAWRSVFAYVPLMLKVTLAVVLGVSVFAAYRSAASASFFEVKTIDVEGARRASREEIREAVRQMTRAGVWHADLDLIAREVSRMTWVREVVVSRVLPSGLRVRVVEREPRLVARSSQGRLVWVDDDGVVLGAAQADDDGFIVRGLDESRRDEKPEEENERVAKNRERVATALDLSRKWTQDGLTRRISEVNLSDLRDVRVQLAGQDAHVEVRLGREEFARRFRQALEVLDAQRATARGPYITYVDVSQGRRAVVGTGATAHAITNEKTETEDETAADEGLAGETAVTVKAGAAPAAVTQTAADSARAQKKQSAASAVKASASAGKKAEKKEKQPEKKQAEKKKKTGPERRADVALRPRRVVE